MSLTLIAAPILEPMTLAEAKLHLRVDGTDEDDLITALIVAARRRAEHLLTRALITQTWELTLDEFPAADIQLPKPGVLSIVSVKYLDSAGVEYEGEITAGFPALRVAVKKPTTICGDC